MRNYFYFKQLIIMKRKLKVVLVLIALSLTGIIIFQVYWSFNAFKVNKQRFDGDINIAMQRALDSCKKDYFDSIRVVMVKRLSADGFFIKIDTAHEADTVHKQLSITFGNKLNWLSSPVHMTSNVYDFYRQKIPHHNATRTEVLTEASFYMPELMNNLMLVLGLNDISENQNVLQAFLKAHSDQPSDSVMAHNKIIESGTYQMPPNYRQADSIKLSKYYAAELRKIHPHTRFELVFSDKPIPAKAADPHHVDELRYSETDEQPYNYHGFLFVNHNIFDHLYVRAIFRNPQFGILNEMVKVLVLSGLLILFTIFCFYYIIRTIVHQKRLTELKDDFINNMTHELKTPIATITVAIEGLQKYNALNDPEKTQRYLQTSRNELTRLNDLVSKVLNVAAFDNKEINLVKEAINIDDLLNELISAEKLKTDKEISITYTNNSNIAVINADKLHFRNVLGNILDNAVKYSIEPVVIHIDLTKSGSNAVFSIKDNGIGISQAHIKHIFGKFYRVPAGNVHNVKGTGLGLNYVKYIVAAHGGSVAVKSEVNAGTEFTVTIPLTNE